MIECDLNLVRSATLNNIRFQLCETPVLGLVLFMANQCGFDRPVEGVPLGPQAGASVVVEFVAPASTEYDLELIVKGLSPDATKRSLRQAGL